MASGARRERRATRGIPECYKAVPFRQSVVWKSDTVGEAIGLVQDLPPAGALVERLAAEAEARLSLVMRTALTP